uniref:Uncharacterized protein n=1 Tax=Solibacter usitatus (strain Ellin6076) TaxID=234267 RepID=Q02C31_SOLUE
MQVSLTPHGEELLRQQLARGLGRSPEEVVERALETVAQQDVILTEEEKKRRREAVAAMLAFRETHHLTLEPGVRIQDLLHEGHKY